jgi:Fe-S cluster biogenesis protein NfuA
MGNDNSIKAIISPSEVSAVLDVSINDLNEILEDLRPYIAMDGGDIQVVKLLGTVVYVELTGACDGCGQADVTLKYGIEELLRERVHPDIEVCQFF